jgi:hypothetical protein
VYVETKSKGKTRLKKKPLGFAISKIKTPDTTLSLVGYNI